MRKAMSLDLSPEDIARAREASTRATLDAHKAKIEDLERKLHVRDKVNAHQREQTKNALRLLKNLVNGLRSTDLEVPGYEDAMAFFIQEKMLNRGGDIEIEPSGDITISFPSDGRIFKL